uniref:Putative secreted protein n=1 Tax=Amblyomma triste TaxID=251400 RepID=A0A023G213_AMBTT
MFPLYVCTVIGLFVTAHTALLERTELKEEPPLSGIGPQSETKPDCTHNKESGYTYNSCSYTCEGDEAFFLEEKQPCYLAGSSGAKGVCVNGECTAVTTSDKEPVPEPQPPVLQPESQPKPETEPEPQPQV